MNKVTTRPLGSILIAAFLLTQLNTPAADRAFELVWSADLPGLGSPGDCAVNDNAILFCDTSRGLLAIDASDPTSLELLGGLSVGMPQGYRGWGRIAVIQTMAYVARGSTLFLIEVSNPGSPKVIKSLNFAPAGDNDEVTGIAVYDGIVCVAYYASGMVVVDATSPDDALVVSRIDLGGGRDVVLRPHLQTLYALVAVWNGGLKVVEVTDPYSPNVVSSIPTPSRIEALTVDGSRLLLAAGDSGLHVFDVTNARSPAPQISLDLGGVVHGVIVRDGFAYASVDAVEDELVIVDIRNPLQMAVVGRGVTGGNKGELLLGHYVLTSTFGGGRGSLGIMDVQNSGSPGLVDEYSTAIFDWLNPQPRLAMIGGLGLLAARSSGLTVLDLRDEAHPRWVSSLNTQGEARAVVTQGAVAYVGDSSFALNDGLNQAEVAGKGVVAVDLTDPAQPVRLGATLESEVIRDVAVGGETIYVATDDHGLAIVDASNNQDLRVVGYYREREPAQAVSVQGKQAYISYADRIEMLDISDGHTPRKTGELYLQYYSGFDANPRPFFVSEKEVVVSTYDSDWGVYSQTILDFNDPANPLQVGRLQTSASWIAGVGDDVIFVVGDRLEAYSFDKLAIPQHLAAHDLNEASSAAAGWYEVAVSGPLGFFVDSAGLRVFDLSDAHSPVQIGAVASEALGVGDIPSNPSKRIAADESGTRVLVSGVVSTRIVDVSDPSQPALQGLIPVPALDIKTRGNLV